jgi:hypothetical protein
MIDPRRPYTRPVGMPRPAAVSSAPPPPNRAARHRVQVSSGLWVAIGVGAALVVAVAWIPLRRQNATVDVALALVVVITAMGATGRRVAVAGTAIGAAAGFTFFDTAPYERFTVARLPDVETAVLLVVVGVVTGELAVRVARQRHSDQTVTGDLGRVREAASLLANGEELVVMIGSVADELTRLLGLRDCWFAADPVEPGALSIEREGFLRRCESPGPVVRSAYRQGDEVALPVWGQGQILGHFVLEVPVTVVWPREQLLVAVTLADQVGAALFAQAPPGPPISATGPAVTVPPIPSPAPSGPPGSTQPTAGAAPRPDLRVIRDGPRATHSRPRP